MNFIFFIALNCFIIFMMQMHLNTSRIFFNFLSMSTNFIASRQNRHHQYTMTMLLRMNLLIWLCIQKLLTYEKYIFHFVSNQTREMFNENKWRRMISMCDEFLIKMKSLKKKRTNFFFAILNWLFNSSMKSLNWFSKFDDDEFSSDDEFWNFATTTCCCDVIFMTMIKERNLQSETQHHKFYTNGDDEISSNQKMMKKWKRERRCLTQLLFIS